MSAPGPGASSPDRLPLAVEPSYFTRLPDDLDDEAELSARPGPSAILRALLRLLRRSRCASNSIECTVADLAREAGVSTRTTSTHLARLDRRGYVGREPVSPAGGQTGRRTRFTLLYELRPTCPADAKPEGLPMTPSASNQKNPSPSNQKNPSPSNQKNPSPSNQKNPSVSLLIQEQRGKTEEQTTTAAAVVAESPSFSDRSERRSAQDEAEKPGCDELEDLVVMAQAHWPHEPALRPRLARLASEGPAEAALAIEYAALMNAKLLVYAFKTRDRWRHDRYRLDDCQAEVDARWSKLNTKSRAGPRRVAAEVPHRPAPEPSDPEAARLLGAMIRATGERREQLRAELARRAASEAAPASEGDSS